MLEVKHIDYQSETTLCVYFGDRIEIQLALEIAQLAELIRIKIDGLMEVIPSSTSLFIEFHTLQTDTKTITRKLRKTLTMFQFQRDATQHLELPIYYHPEVAPDLINLADKNNLTVDEVIQMHSDGIYTVSSLGFAPGFAYLAGIDPRLATPRLNTPKNVTKGSLGIADYQTAIYPKSSPGGWSIIGNCPVTLFDLKDTPITPFSIGMTVKFKPVTRENFLKQGGEL